MSKWAVLLEQKYAVVLPCDNSAKSDKNSFVPSVPFVTREQDWRDAFEERAAIMEYDAPDVHPDRQAAEAGAYEDCKTVWIERNRK